MTVGQSAVEFAVLCPSCGIQLKVPATAPQSPPAPAFSSRDLRCPNCQGTQTQRVSVIFQAGTSVSRTVTLGSGLIIGSDLSFAPLLGRAASTATEQTHLAQLLSPPEEPVERLFDAKLVSAVSAFVVAVVLFLVILLRLGLWDDDRAAASEALADIKAALIASVVSFIATATLAWVVLVPMARKHDAARALKFDRAMKVWKSSFFCNRCGHAFVPPG
jgi:fumarate reductase subunit D